MCASLNCALLYCIPTSLITGMLESATDLTGDTSVTSNVAFMAGSSQQGNARRASVDSNCVTAMFFLLPSPAEQGR